MWLNYAFSISAVLLSVLAVYIYLISKKDAYRFFYPALVLFVLFSLVPISYSVYVSFTNLKTGHVLDREAVIKLFRDELILEKNSELLEFKLYKTVQGLLLIVDNLGAEFEEGESVLILKTLTRLDPSIRQLSPGDVLDLKELTALKIIHPALGEFRIYRSDTLAKVKPRYILNDEGGFTDSVTGKKLIEDKQKGLFLLDGESAGPGYYTEVGFENYKTLLLDPATQFIFIKAFTWTVVWSVLSVALSFALGAFLAVLLNDMKGKSKLVYRMIFIIPYSIPFFISVLMFKGMLNKDFGEVNNLLQIFKISPVPWLENKVWARVSVLMVNLWLGFPYMLLVITGILQSIPKSIYEASSIEGATKFQNFRYLTFPLVIRAMIPLLIGSFAFNFNNFVGIYLLTGGGPVIADVNTPLGETDILISYTYRLAFEGAQGQNFALAAAVSMLIFVVIVGLTILNFKVTKKLNS